MTTIAQRWSRRRFLTTTGLAPAAGMLATACTPAAEPPPAVDDVYGRLGVRPFINAAGTYTALSASLMPAEVKVAMAAASEQFVALESCTPPPGAESRSSPGRRRRW